MVKNKSKYRIFHKKYYNLKPKIWPHTTIDMPKIQRVKAYDYKDHSIYKYRLNISSDIIEKLEWKEGTEVELKIKNKKLEVSEI